MRTARVPAGQRIYAIGDVHGESALLARLLDLILIDSKRRGAAEVTLVLLGDFIDRGQGAASLLLQLSRSRSDDLVILKGNHEAIMVDACRGNMGALDFWLRHGGEATLSGLGISAVHLDNHDHDALSIEIKSMVATDLIDWLDRLPTSWSSGDYYFVHAGIRPKRALDLQEEKDQLWIRSPFLNSRRDHGKVIVHGHSVERTTPSLGTNRIGIDTGAHLSGLLTAVGLEDSKQWLIQATVDQI